MNLTIEVQDNFKKILIKSDSSSANTDYPVLEVYLNDTLVYTLVVGGSDTIGSTTYTTTSGATNLNYASTTTTLGTEYIHTISTSTLGLTADQRLDNGVWKFKALDANETTNLFIGAVIHNDIDCCIMENLDSVCDGNCSIDKVLDEANKVRALLYSAEISAKKGEFTNAKCKYLIAKTLCSSCIT